MKKLSRNERIGAAVIALIAIILIVITYLIAGSRQRGEVTGDVTITIEQRSDTTESREESQAKPEKEAANAEYDTTKTKKRKTGKKGKRGKSGKSSTKSSKTKSTKKREANPMPPRDLLRDTIPKQKYRDT
ncbi:MAG: hypothetical protein KIG61_04615 [Muribaculaceae bacterium]|nr:hypothetical protein [Muribaculaceae bacterium]